MPSTNETTDVKLTRAMWNQLMDYAVDKGASGEYWGNRQQFLHRHDKIIEWLKQNEPK